ncbi:hypothetical protein PS6_011684 [Mucor atramentarius]
MVDMRDEAREQLERLLYQPGEAFNAFMNKFQQLRGQAEIQDEDCVVRYLIKALPEELANHTKFYLNTNADRGDINVDFAVTKITTIYNVLFKDKWGKEKRFSSSTTTAASSSAPKIKSQYSSNNRSDKKKLKCIYHPQFSNHSTEDCNISEDHKKRRLAANKKLNNNNKRPCMYCKDRNWTPEHNRVCKKLTKSNQKKRAIVPSPTTSDEINSSDDNMDTDTEDSEKQNLTFAAMTVKDCIIISNMAMHWDDNNNPEIPPIDPNPYIPNSSPYGIDAEKEHFMKEIVPYIQANKNIDPKTYCNIPVMELAPSK